MPTKTNAAVETMTADVQKNMTQQVEKATKSFESVTAFNQETLDAMMKSQTIAAKAAEEIQAEVLAFSKKTVEETVAHAKELASVQTLNDFIEKQSGYAKASLDSMMRQSAKLNELMVAATKEVFAPLNARATAAADLVKAQA